MRISAIAYAVAATLAASAAMALGPTTVHDVSLNVAGSSAFAPSFVKEFKALCSDTMDTYNATSTGTVPAMQALSCTLGAGAGALANKTAVVYYRAEGGSAYGVAPIAKGQQIYRLAIPTCTISGTANVYNCPVSNWNLGTEGGLSGVGPVVTGAIFKDTVQLGVSDLEPEKFLGDNWPGGFFTTEPTATELSNISSITPLIGQVFAVYVNNGLGATLNLSKQTLTAIFQGQYADWNTVPKADGTGFVSASSVPLKLCNRDVGSGTRAGVLLYFNGYSCNPAAGTFLTTGPKVVTALNNDTGAERTCIKNTVGGIGYAVIQTAANVTANNMTVVSINGVLPTVGNAAAGQYDYWFEATFNSGSALGGNAAVLAGILQTNIGTAANAPAGNVGLVALADYNTPVVGAAIQTANMPIALGTHGGNSCALPNSAL